MDIEFDPEKDRYNQVKHGLSLARAAAMDLAQAVIIPDERFDYGEQRYWALAPIDARLHVLTFTMRGETVRAISLRKANERERRRHARAR